MSILWSQNTFPLYQLHISFCIRKIIYVPITNVSEKKILPDLNAIAYFSNTMHFDIYAVIILIRKKDIRKIYHHTSGSTAKNYLSEIGFGPDIHGRSGSYKRKYTCSCWEAEGATWQSVGCHSGRIVFACLPFYCCCHSFWLRPSLMWQ